MIVLHNTGMYLLVLPDATEKHKTSYLIVQMSQLQFSFFWLSEGKKKEKARKEKEKCTYLHFSVDWPSNSHSSSLYPLLVHVNSYRFGRTCFLDTDGQVTCDCPQGYIGRRCEQCAAGYQGNPFIPGDSCRQGNSHTFCSFTFSSCLCCESCTCGSVLL